LKKKCIGQPCITVYAPEVLLDTIESDNTMPY